MKPGFANPEGEIRAGVAGIRHRCMIYEGSPDAHLPGLARTMAEKLSAGLRVMYLNSPAMVAGIRSYLYAAGIDVAAASARGNLILSSSDEHLADGNFDPATMLSLLEAALDDALTHGYAGLWASGDMTWEFGSKKNYSKLREYERALEELFGRRPELQGVCQYHADTLPPGMAAEALHLHRACHINETLSRLNRYYAQEAISISAVESMLARTADWQGMAGML